VQDIIVLHRKSGEKNQEHEIFNESFHHEAHESKRDKKTEYELGTIERHWLHIPPFAQGRTGGILC
jgi:hypothetical protein